MSHQSIYISYHVEIMLIYDITIQNHIYNKKNTETTYIYNATLALAATQVHASVMYCILTK